MKHLEEKGMTYFEHMCNAGRFARYSALVAAIYFTGMLRYIVHAIYPNVFGNSTAQWMVKQQVKASERLENYRV